MYFSESSEPSSHSDASDDEEDEDDDEVEEPILVESSESEPEFDCEDWDTDSRVVDVAAVAPICGCALFKNAVM